MGYVSSQSITDDLTFVSSDGECSLHIDGNELEDTKIIELTDDQFKMLLGCLLSEFDGKHTINDIAAYTDRVFRLEMLLSDAQAIIEDAEKVTSDEFDLKYLREWLGKYRKSHEGNEE